MVFFFSLAGMFAVIAGLASNIKEGFLLACSIACCEVAAAAAADADRKK